MSVAVSVNGKTAWSAGFGYSNVEDMSPCRPDTVMRIASVSKCVAAALVLKHCEDGLIDLDAPVQKYVPSFPKKTFQGEQVTITTRLLLSHLSGIRHYKEKTAEEKMVVFSLNEQVL